MSVRYLLLLSAKAHGGSIQLLEILIIEQINVEPRRCHMHLQKKKHAILEKLTNLIGK
jgi:hypothetical protein